MCTPPCLPPTLPLTPPGVKGWVPSHCATGGLLWGQMWPVTAPLLEGIEVVVVGSRFCSAVCQIYLLLWRRHCVSSNVRDNVENVCFCCGCCCRSIRLFQLLCPHAACVQKPLQVAQVRTTKSISEMVPGEAGSPSYAHTHRASCFFLPVIRSSDSTSAHKGRRAAKKRLVGDTESPVLRADPSLCLPTASILPAPSSQTPPQKKAMKKKLNPPRRPPCLALPTVAPPPRTHAASAESDVD